MSPKKAKSRSPSKRKRASPRRPRKTTAKSSPRRSKSVRRWMVYGRPGCPFCRAAGELLGRKNIPFDAVDVTDPVQRARMRKRFPSATTVPQIVDDLGRHVGGYDPGLVQRLDGVAPACTHGKGKVPRWWTGLHGKIRACKHFCYLRSRGPHPSMIDAFASTEMYVNRNPTLDPRRISFEQVRYGEYAYFQSPSGTMLLIPPLDVGATDITDFAKRYGVEEWNQLYIDIISRWRPGMWVDTSGHVVPYLHIRFERTPLYNPTSSHRRL